MDTQRKSSGSIWFWGIFISLLIFALLFAGISFIFLAGSILKTSEKSYKYETIRDGSGKIAVIEIDYTIFKSEPLIRQLKKYRDDKSIKAIILRIDSPGGGSAASFEMYEEVRRTRESGKPVIVSHGSIAASGGYLVSCGGNIIVSNPSSITGSIGVIATFTTVYELLDKIGIKETSIVSGEFKDTGSPFREMRESEKKYIQEIIDDTFEQFFDIVAKERKIDREKLKTIANGRIYTGRQAKELGLVDTLGTFEDAVKIAADLAGITGEPTLVKEVKERNIIEFFLESNSSNSFNILKNDLYKEIFNKPLIQYKFEP
ncbi:MAG: signal peptide peptidase SppA [Ignavibacteria bacterium]|nr:signal peptide peptidase SppA [Ignavibacteria bacterium]